MGMEKTTEMVLAWELHEQGLSQSAIARRLGRHRETIITWIQGMERYGLKGYVDKTQRACKVARPTRQVDALVKRWVWSIREREEQCCGQQIAYFLEREPGVQLAVPKIYEILAEKYVLRVCAACMCCVYVLRVCAAWAQAPPSQARPGASSRGPTPGRASGYGAFWGCLCFYGGGHLLARSRCYTAGQRHRR